MLTERVFETRPRSKYPLVEAYNRSVVYFLTIPNAWTVVKISSIPPNYNIMSAHF